MEDKIREIINELAEIGNMLDNNEISDLFLQLKKSENSIQLKGNSEGLIYLARMFLTLAIKNGDAHMHFDEYTSFDECDKDFIIRKVLPDW